MRKSSICGYFAISVDNLSESVFTSLTTICSLIHKIHKPHKPHNGDLEKPHRPHKPHNLKEKRRQSDSEGVRQDESCCL